jgi:hypothetical protein
MGNIRSIVDIILAKHHKCVYRSELGWQGDHFGALVCECGKFLPYEVPR